jgi:hypothetical protein
VHAILPNPAKVQPQHPSIPDHIGKQMFVAKHQIVVPVQVVDQNVQHKAAHMDCWGCGHFHHCAGLILEHVLAPVLEQALALVLKQVLALILEQALALVLEQVLALIQEHDPCVAAHVQHVLTGIQYSAAHSSLFQF